jgi:hypothetical protein
LTGLSASPEEADLAAGAAFFARAGFGAAGRLMVFFAVVAAGLAAGDARLRAGFATAGLAAWAGRFLAGVSVDCGLLSSAPGARVGTSVDLLVSSIMGFSFQNKRSI